MTISKQISDHYDAGYDAAEKLLREKRTNGEDFTDQDYAWLQNKVGWDAVTSRLQRRRIAKVMHFEAVVGTSKDREKLDAQIAAAQKEYDEKAPGIRDQIAKLQAELTKLDCVGPMQRRRGEIQETLQKLSHPNVLDPVTNSERGRLKKELAAEIGRDLVDAEHRCHILERCLAGDDGQQGGHERYIDSVKAYANEFDHDLNTFLDSKTGTDRVIRSRVNAEWKAHLPALEAELKEADKTRAEIQKWYDDANAKIQELTQRYWR